VRSAIIDGEAVVEDGDGISRFVDLVEDLKSGHGERVRFIAFDLLYLAGKDMTGLPLFERKAKLQDLIGTSTRSRVRYSDHLAGNGSAMLTEACRRGLEGIVSKRIDKPYRSGRQTEWLKAKCGHADELIIGGYLHSTALRKAIGALALGFFDDGSLVYAGRVGTGFSHRSAADLWRRLRPLRTDTCPFAARLTAAQRGFGQGSSPKWNTALGPMTAYCGKPRFRPCARTNLRGMSSGR
jgi:bifunctional non-homologous end joining protein LigD